MSANYLPNLNTYTDLKPFRFWCQKVLPLAYDDSLSYYELLNKVVDYLNKTMEDVTLSIEDVQKLHTAYEQLETYVNDYFDNLDVQEEINTKLDSLVEDGTIHDIFNPDVEAILSVANQAASDAIEAIPSNVTAWLDTHVTPETEILLDESLTIEGAAADAKAAGDQIRALKSDLDEITVWSDSYTPLVAIRSETGKYVFNNTYNNKLNESTDATMGYSVYAIVPGKYKIYGFGYDRYQFYMGVIGNNANILESGSYVSDFIQNIECGGSEYPADYTYHTVEIEIATEGYLFVNYKIEQSVGSCSKAALATVTDPAVLEKIANVADSSRTHGLVKDGNAYYHFVALGSGYLLRKFTQRGGNNLFQWAGIYLGNVTADGVTITSTIINYDTDIIGPITIFNTTLWPGQYGEWSGGNHTKTIDGTAYPTAKQDSIKVLVNGAEVTDDGVYYGDAKIITVNSLYFPQSVTDADLANATKAIVETREYSLDKQLKVRVKLAFVETTRVSLYYGMQAVIAPYQDILFANNVFYGALPNNENRNFAQKEHEVILNAENGLRLIVALSDIGLGTFSQNDGSTGYATLPSASVTRKLYYRLIDGASSHGYENGDVLMWEGKYSIEQV